MKIEHLENWDFSVDEVSNGVYQVTATDKQGRKVEMTGIDVEQLISDCKNAASEIDEKVANHRTKDKGEQ